MNSKSNLAIFKIHKFEFKRSWILLLFFTIIYFLITALFILQITNYTFKTVNSITKISFLNPYVKLKGSDHGFFYGMEDNGYAFRNILLNAPAIVLFLIFSQIMINKVLLVEINHGEIYTWLTLPINRKKIILGKMSSIFLMNIIIFLPSFLYGVLMTCFYGVSSEWARMLLFYLEFLVFIFLMISIFIIVSLALSNNSFLTNFICSIITTWIILSFAMTQVYEAQKSANNEVHGFIANFKYIKYFSFQSLIISTIDYDNEILTKTINQTYLPNGKLKHYYVLTYVLIKKVNWKLLIPFTLLTTLITFINSFINIKLFKTKNFLL
ncbi:ABC transporter permease subunit [Spiroplasma endosymbiont of Crioceris asparagi]|uniref:ABC transporter permease subunit n=1 Tax=Spiroplasma endosymbiont of Crioceris asparagi TaxID=3066286 RepID=UPI0030D0207C